MGILFRMNSYSNASPCDTEVLLLNLLGDKVLMGKKFIKCGKTRLFMLSVFSAALKGAEVVRVNLACYFYVLRQNPVSALVNVLSG